MLILICHHLPCGQLGLLGCRLLEVNCVSVECDTSLLERVIGLHRRNSVRLGQFPVGAFEECATEDRIIAAVAKSGELVGYLLFHCTKRRAVIVHFCIDKSYRSIGSSVRIGEALFSEFLSRTKDHTNKMLGASVSCRSDYGLQGVWRHLGFHCTRVLPAKKPGHSLEGWWYDFGRDSLFTYAAKPELVALDANVFFDILNPDAEHHIESYPLLDDWLASKFSCAITPELFEELERANDNPRKQLELDKANELLVVTGSSFNTSYDQINLLLGTPSSESAKSDQRQLAHAVAGDATYFVTRDTHLLNNHKSLFHKFALRTVHPSELIRKFDEDARPEAYKPFKLDGSDIDIRLVAHSELNAVVRRFLNYPAGERKGNLRDYLARAMSDASRYTAELVESSSGDIIGLIVTESCSSSTNSIRILRVSTGKLNTTLVWHLLWRGVQTTVESGARVLRFCDIYASEAIGNALADIGFVYCGSTWQKLIPRSAMTCHEIKSELEYLVEAELCPKAILNDVHWDLDRFSDETVGAETRQLERQIWPAMLKGRSIENFIVAIEPEWAQRLFDCKAGADNLFGSEANLLLRFENAYYRSCRQRLPLPLSRILWYIKGSKDGFRSKCILASSLVNKVVCSTPETLIRSFADFGVYEYKDLKAIKSSSAGCILAFTFSHTLLLPRPIQYQDAVELLRSRSVPINNFQSPLKLDENTWLDLYSMGFPEGLTS